MELYQAEQQGKQIMVRESHSGLYSYNDTIKKVQISECQMSTLVSDDLNRGGYPYTFFIKDEEDEYGCKLNE
jgi:hypothetical protein